MKYYGILKGLWQEWDQYCEAEWENGKDAAQFKRLLEKERVFEFQCTGQIGKDRKGFPLGRGSFG